MTTVAEPAMSCFKHIAFGMQSMTTASKRKAIRASIGRKILPTLVLFPIMLAAPASMAQSRTGTATTTLQHIKAFLLDGSPAPHQYDEACQSQLSSPGQRFIGLKVTTTYDINTTTLMMSANSEFQHPSTAGSQQVSVKLTPLGIAKSYSFGTFEPSGLSPIRGVLFSLNTSFENPNSTFLIHGPESAGYNCGISSDPFIMTSTQAPRFKSEQTK